MGARGLIRRIDENTAVPLKVVVPVMAALMGMVVWLSDRFGSIDHRLTALETKLDTAIRRHALAPHPPLDTALVRTASPSPEAH